MFGEGGPSFLELMKQALSSTEHGYDLLATKFDVTPFRTPDEVVGRSLEELGELDAALDVCTGTGAALPFLHTMTKRRLVGLDFSEGMLGVAQSRMKDRGEPPSLELVRGDALALEYDAEFDLVTCYGALGHVVEADMPRFLGGIAKSLRPGGRFVFVTSDMPPRLSRERIVARTFNGVMRIRNAIVRPPFIMYYLTFMLPDIARVLTFYGFDVRIDEGWFPEPHERLKRVVATRRG
ncbi:MAG: class I SAM-dependent methyltransferase [Polyangiaceae bacterium]